MAAERLKDRAQIVIRAGQVGLQGQRLFDECPAAFAIAMLKVGKAKQIERVCILGIVPKHLPVCADRFGQQSAAVKSHRLFEFTAHCLKHS